MSRRRPLVILSALVGAAAVGSAVTLTLLHPTNAAVPAAPATTTAQVVRTDLSNTALAEGTLGYAPAAPVVNQLSGTYTSLSAPGTVVLLGQTLYRVDDLPVVLMGGSLPAWRPFAYGMTDGPDVAELTANLIASGNATGLLGAPSDHFDAATAAAVRRWQQSNGEPVTGDIPRGQIVFRDSLVRVGAANTDLGAPARPGDVPYQLTTAAPVVTVTLNASLPPVRAGNRVSIQLPDNSQASGIVFAVSPAAPPSGTSQNSGGNSNSSDNTSPPPMIATIIPSRSIALGSATDTPVQVAFATQTVRAVLAVPISALLALAGGGYGVEVVGPAGVHHLTAVTTGLYTATQVEISGSGLRSGTNVVVAQ